MNANEVKTIVDEYHQTAMGLLVALQECKRAESAANERRIAAEDALIDALSFSRNVEGAETYDIDCPTGTAKVVLKQPFNRTVDSGRWLEIAKGIPSEIARDIMRTKYELNVGAMRNIIETAPAVWDAISECVNSRPGKVNVEIKFLEQK